jgi:xanthosine utilization system XapX-like protein
MFAWALWRLSQVKVRVALRPTVSRPVSLGVKPHLGPKIRFLLLSDSCSFVDVGRPFWREDGSVICLGHSQQYMSSIFTSLLVGILHSHLSKSPVPCAYILFTLLYVILVYMYAQYIQGRNAIRIECYNFEGPVNSRSRVASQFLIQFFDGHYSVLFWLGPIELCRDLLKYRCDFEHVVQRWVVYINWLAW